MAKHLILSDYDMFNHVTRAHPESAGRLLAILEAFEERPCKEFLNLSVKRRATVDEIMQVHEPAYVNDVLALKGRTANLDPETQISPGSVDAALLAAGLCLELADQVVKGKIENGFALVRPPGHHSRPSAAMGFCVFNNIAIACKRALDMGIKRILIFDWDVHHGNGTQEVFYEDERVLFIDIHQENLFPQNSGLIKEIGSGKGLGFTVNLPLPPSCGDNDYLYAFDQIVEPLAVRFRPELILVSAGFDAHESDPLGGMKLTTKGFGLLAARVKRLAEVFCEGKMI
ncbi:MAG TPA: histone deacetylase, partial [Parachlamydiaceae bacterium]|nr:histone deacetylase [Parachlamydiaceae bacterium]